MSGQFTPKEQESRRNLLKVALSSNDDEFVMKWQTKRKQARMKNKAEKANSVTYIGVSANSGTKWQIRHAREGFQRSIGTVGDEIPAAILADIFVL